MNDLSHLNISPENFSQFAALLNGTKPQTAQSFSQNVNAFIDQIVASDPKPISTNAQPTGGTKLPPQESFNPTYINGQQNSKTSSLSPMQLSNLVHQSLQKNANFQMALNALPPEQGLEFTKSIQLAVQQKISTLPPPILANQLSKALGEAVGTQLLAMIQSGSVDAKTMAPILDQVRVNTISLYQPSLNFLIDLQYNTLLQEGKSPEDAKMLANSHVLNQIDNNLSQQGVTKTVVGDNPKLGKVISTALSALLQESMGSNGAILAGGLTATGNIAAAASSYLQNLVASSQANQASVTIETSDAGPVSDVSPALNVQMTAMATGAVRTMNDQITELLSAENSLGAPPANSTEWMRTLTLMMSKLQMLVTEMQIADTSNLKKISAAQVEVEKKKAEADLKKLDEQMKAQGPKPWWMKFLMIFFAVIIEIVIAAITIVSGGAGAPILVAVSVLMFGVTMALNETGILEKGLGALMNAFAHAISHLMPEASAKAFLASMMIITAIIIAIVSDGAAASSIGDVAETIAATTVVNVIGQTAQATARSVVTTATTRVAIKQAIDQVSIQLITLLVASSGVFQNIAIALTPDPIKQAAIAGALTILFMIATLGVAINTGFKNADLMSSVLKNLDKEARTAAETILSKIVTTVGPVLEGVGMAGQAAVQIYGATISIKEAEIKKEIAELNKMIMLLEAIIKMLQDLIKGFQNDTSSLQNYSKSLSDSFERALQGASQSITSLFAAQKKAA